MDNPHASTVSKTGNEASSQGTSGEIPAVFRNKIAVNFINEYEIEHSRFWLTFVKNGTLSPHDLMHSNSPQGILKQSSKEGIKDDTPVLLCLDSESTGEKFSIYFMDYPKELNNKQPPPKQWWNCLKSLVNDWKLEELGVYITKDNIPDSVISEFVQTLIYELGREKSLKNLYLPLKSRQFENAIDACISSKNKLSAEDIIVEIFH